MVLNGSSVSRAPEEVRKTETETRRQGQEWMTLEREIKGIEDQDSSAAVRRIEGKSFVCARRKEGGKRRATCEKLDKVERELQGGRRKEGGMVGNGSGSLRLRIQFEGETHKRRNGKHLEEKVDGWEMRRR